ncbi:MAG: hypothetical protein ACXVB6_02150 [Mucilaginibacter sp.]
MKLESFLEMGGGFVLDFSNYKFSQFIQSRASGEIYDEKYSSVAVPKPIG